MTISPAGSDARTARLAVAIAAVLAGQLLAPAGRGSAEEPDRIFIENDVGYYLVAVVERNVYERELTYEVSFRGDLESQLEIGTDDEGLPRFASRPVAALSDLDPASAVLLSCLGEVCRPVEVSQELIGSLGEGAPATAIRLALGPGARPLQRGEDVRLLAEAGWVRLGGGAEGGRPSPAVSVTLPRLSEADQTVLASHPVLRLGLAPTAEDAESEASGSGLVFEGGLHRFRRSHRLGLRYHGTLTTEERLGFDAVHLEGELERNLLDRRSDYLPLKIALGAEADQSFDLVNGLVRASVQYVLPWNVNYSPRDEGFIPTTGPLIRLVAEAGTRLDEDEDEAAAVAAPEDFQRAGYDFHWRLPVARGTELKIHHAGLWVFSSDLPEDEFHSLWDLALETRIGALTYYVGFQKGEAAPLFLPTETTHVGVLVRLGQQLQCQTGDDARHWVCGSP